MSSTQSIQPLLDRLRGGDSQAAAEIFNRYSERLIRLSRSRLSPQMQQKIDPEDVTQSVFRSFFLRQAEGRFELQSWDSLWSLLVRITLRKCGKQITAYQTQRRDISRESKPMVTDDESRCQWEAIAREPTPEEVALLTDTLGQMMEHLNDRQRQMLVLRLQGYTAAEISERVGCSEKTVDRLLARVRKTLTRIEDADRE